MQKTGYKQRIKDIQIQIEDNHQKLKVQKCPICFIQLTKFKDAIIKEQVLINMKKINQ